MRNLLIIFICSFSFLSLAQQPTDVELEILNVLNQVRSDPQQFLKDVAQPYIEKNDLSSNRYARSLLRDLKKQEAVGLLKIDSSLQEMAKDFAVRSGKRGVYGHREYNKRYDEYGSHLATDGENIQYGLSGPLDIVMDLLIDTDVPSLGHRKNILSDKYSVIGIGFAEHKKINYNTVMAFGGF
tara:strand:+ start:118289 stop:118837 length:549 start_codon:yes stop_codon:yes gene_type:complete